ncbi:MAG: hypothetical protein U9N85_03125 [Bacteroidota bacterium]|nr:hypothetical protein [Bacteroidota bacterium]
MRKLIRLTIILLFTIMSLNVFSQQIIRGVITNSFGERIKDVSVITPDTSRITTSSRIGEYKITVPDSCTELIFYKRKFTHSEKINGRKVINPQIHTNNKVQSSLNPKIDYPWGLQITLLGYSLYNVSVNHFINSEYSVEAGLGAGGLVFGGKRYYSLNDYGNNKSFYFGALTAISPGSLWKLYFPVGYHILSKNGMAFGVELAGVIPLYNPENNFSRSALLTFFGAGINFGYQF